MPTETKPEVKVIKVRSILNKLIAQVSGTAMVGFPKSLKPNQVTDPEILKKISLFIIPAVGQAIKQIKTKIDKLDEEIRKGQNNLARFKTKEHVEKVGRPKARLNIRTQNTLIARDQAKLKRHNQLKTRLEKLKKYHTYLNTQQKLPRFSSFNRRTYLKPFITLKTSFKDIL
ncbi:MAG: hypothetical protein KAT77_05130 [Nanoarchaeota archaeon]|nr:hypothetical protein [Nanoarchaeota archaeon]